jgi:YhcH/YjgK/YiaL family protein
MIIDTIDNLSRYNQIPNVNKILEFIENNDINELEVGDIPILGEELYVKVLKYIPQESSKGFFETHDNYADVQFVVKGVEAMFYVNPVHITPTDKFKMEGDFSFFEASKNISDLVVSEGEFAIFLPGEPHKPGCLYKDLSNEVKKLVFKVRIP